MIDTPCQNYRSRIRLGLIARRLEILMQAEWSIGESLDVHRQSV